MRKRPPTDRDPGRRSDGDNPSGHTDSVPVSTAGISPGPSLPPADEADVIELPESLPPSDSLALEVEMLPDSVPPGADGAVLEAEIEMLPDSLPPRVGVRVLDADVADVADVVLIVDPDEVPDDEAEDLTPFVDAPTAEAIAVDEDGVGQGDDAQVVEDADVDLVLGSRDSHELIRVTPYVLANADVDDD